MHGPQRVLQQSGKSAHTRAPLQRFFSVLLHETRRPPNPPPYPYAPTAPPPHRTTATSTLARLAYAQKSHVRRQWLWAHPLEVTISLCGGGNGSGHIHSKLPSPFAAAAMALGTSTRSYHLPLRLIAQSCADAQRQVRASSPMAKCAEHRWHQTANWREEEGGRGSGVGPRVEGRWATYGDIDIFGNTDPLPQDGSGMCI